MKDSFENFQLLIEDCVDRQLYNLPSVFSILDALSYLFKSMRFNFNI